MSESKDSERPTDVTSVAFTPSLKERAKEEADDRGFNSFSKYVRCCVSEDLDRDSVNIDGLVRAFNEKHGVDSDGQFRQLSEEVGELAEAINRDASDSAIVDECADVCFVARSIAILHDELDMMPPETAVRQKAEYNLRKSTETDGSKVTDDV